MLHIMKYLWEACGILPLAEKERLGRRTCLSAAVVYTKNQLFLKAMVRISSWRMSRRGQHGNTNCLFYKEKLPWSLIYYIFTHSNLAKWLYWLNRISKNTLFKQ